MNDNGASTPVVDTPITLRSGGDAGAAARSEKGGQAPPPPSLDNLSPEALRARLKAQAKAKRDRQRQAAVGRVRAVNPRYWVWAGAGVALVAGVIGYRNYRLQMAEITAARDIPVVATTAPVPASGIPNPLMDLPLTGQAQWILGWDNGTLSPTRSANAITQMLAHVDACSLFIGLGPKAEVLVSPTADPAFSPLCGNRVEATPDDSIPLPITTVPEPATTLTVPAG